MYFYTVVLLLPRWFQYNFYTTQTRTQGGVSAVSSHMTRKMWGLIPVLDCSQLLKLCPLQCKPSVCPITTPAAREDPPHHTMSGKKHRGSADTHSRRTDTGTRPLRTGPGLRGLPSSPEISRILTEKHGV